MNRKTSKLQMIENEPYPIFAATRKLFLASIGIIALAQDEIRDFMDKIIERGEIAEKEGKQLMLEFRERRNTDNESAQEEALVQVQKYLEQFNIPTKKEIDQLNEKIDLLNLKIDEQIIIKDEGEDSVKPTT